MNRRMSVWKLGALVLAVGLVGCQNGGDKLTQLPAPEPGSAAQQQEAIGITITQATKQEIVRAVVATGTTEPARVADIGPQLNGRVSALLVEEGDEVKAGAVLVRLDADEAQLRIQQTAAGASQAKAQYELAKSEYERVAPLLDRGTITPQQLQRLALQRDALQSAVEAATVAESDAKRMRGNTTVRAPFAGIVSKVSVEVGEVATMTPTKILARLVDLSSVDVRVRVHERELARINVGDEVEATLPSTSQSAKGKVTFISPEIDPRTRNAEVVTRIPNAQHALRAGMFAEISIRPKGSTSSLVIPASAVAGAGDGRYVFLINGDRTKRQPVKVAPIDQKTVEVLEGLSEGQQLVREGLGRLSEGALVKVDADKRGSAAGATP